MKGTEKQIAWAKDIIKSGVDYLDERIAYDKELGLSGNHEIAYRILRAAYNNLLYIAPDAARVIDNRRQFSGSQIEKDAYWFENILNSGKLTADELAAKNGVMIY